MTRIFLAVALAAGLSACSLTNEERAVFRDSLAEAAIAVIEEAKVEGLAPVEIPEGRLRAIRLGCFAGEVFAPMLDAYIAAKSVDDPEFQPIDFRGYVAAACAVAEAALEAEPDPAV